jgi:PIN domain nuclease of toxin-antitoxin system
VTNVVLDASALLALLLREPGAERVAATLDGGLLGVVNLAEVVSYFAKQGLARRDIEDLLRPLPLRVVPADMGLSYAAAMLRPLTLQQGLSLGDRYCLALAKQERLPTLTAERRWPAIAAKIGVDVQLIR